MKVNWAPKASHVVFGETPRTVAASLTAKFIKSRLPPRINIKMKRQRETERVGVLIAVSIKTEEPKAQPAEMIAAL